jgi:hypothetical protein
MHAGKRRDEANLESGAKNDGRLGVGGNIFVAWMHVVGPTRSRLFVVSGIAKVNGKCSAGLFQGGLR